MKAQYTGLSVVGWKVMLDSWWSKTLAIFVLANVILGTLYFLFMLIRKIVKSRANKTKSSIISPAVARHFQKLMRNDVKQQITEKLAGSDKYNTFGVFLGDFEEPLTSSQRHILTSNDLLVLDPLQQGVLRALLTTNTPSSSVLGRLSIKTLVNAPAGSKSQDLISQINLVSDFLLQHLSKRPGVHCPFRGVLLADFEEHFNPAIVNQLAQYVESLGLQFWLELSPPSYLEQNQSGVINFHLVNGVIYRNGTIRPDGDIQNFFQMEPMRNAMRVIAAQRVAHGPPAFAWETVENSSKLDYAVVQRSYNWCRYNNILSWIGTTAALYQSESALWESVPAKPLGALMWLKAEDNMKAHNIWRENTYISKISHDNAGLYDSLASFVPDLNTRLAAQLSLTDDSSDSDGIVVDGLPWQNQTHAYFQADPLCASAAGDSFTGLGCFHLGLEVSHREYLDVLQVQRDLRELNLLQPAREDDLQALVEQLENLIDARQSYNSLSITAAQAISELLGLLTINLDGSEPRIQIFFGLHSGFQTNGGAQFFGLFANDSNGCMQLYISNKSKYRPSTIVHTFLSSRGCSRDECFAAEYALAEHNGQLSETWKLPLRLVNDIEQLSPEETILLLKRLAFCGDANGISLLRKVNQCCHFQIIDKPCLAQLRKLNSESYLRHEIRPESLVISRLSWLREQGCWCPDNDAAVLVFEEVASRLVQVLMRGETEILSQISTVVQKLVSLSSLDATADIFLLSIFCAVRSLALDEVYLEVLDRNPYPNHSTDQAACFAENFALGSRCDSFFDMTPRAVGKIISDRYRAYYMHYQPPLRVNGFTELPTAYAAMQIDLDPNDGQEATPWYYQITFLGLFALPALCDVALLTTVGRGLYLSTFMTDMEKRMATMALMIALLVSGAIGAWITSGGSYYFYANAFPAMNMFVLTRFVAGLAVALIGGIAGMIGLMVSHSWDAGLVFLFYFLVLSTYLSTLSALSIYQLPGSSFQSGRTIVFACVPILFISPILTLWVGRDLLIYTISLSCFLFSLLYGARKVITQWSSWYLNIPCITDAEILVWYNQTKEHEKLSATSSVTLTGNELLNKARNHLVQGVMKEVNRNFWQRSTKDKTILKLADGYARTAFLMKWFTRHKRSRMPMPYSATWNLSLKAALEAMTNMQRGLKLHNAFLHWRQTGSDIWSGLLYFVVALLDKWVALFLGLPIVGISFVGLEEYVLAVGFSLCYYLIGAVCLDAISQKLWTTANETSDRMITSLQSLRQASIQDAQARRALYWKNFLKFLFVHLWGLAVTTSLMWTFKSSRNATTMYLAYIAAYTGLLWYQYNKIYCGNRAAKCLTLAAACGLPTCIALHLCAPNFPYSGVVGLGTATWVAAIHSIIIAKIGWPTILRFKIRYNWKLKHANVDDFVQGNQCVYYASMLEPQPELSQSTLGRIFDGISDLPTDQRYPLDCTQHPGVEVIEILEHQSRASRRTMIHHAFPAAPKILQSAVQLLRSGRMVVELVSSTQLQLVDETHTARAYFRRKADRILLYVVLGAQSIGDDWAINIRDNCQMIVEAVVRATTEAHLGFTHDHSVLSELLVVNQSDHQDQVALPEGVKRQLKLSFKQKSLAKAEFDKYALRYVLLGINCDIQWEELPKSIRSFLLERCRGNAGSLTYKDEAWLRANLCTEDCSDVEQYIARCNLGVSLMSSIKGYALKQGGQIVDRSRFRESLTDSVRNNQDKAFEITMVPQNAFVGFCSQVARAIHGFLKFLILSLTADPGYQRELNFVLQRQPFVLVPSKYLLNTIWSFSKALQQIVLPLALFSSRPDLNKLREQMKGFKTTLHKRKIVIDSPSGTTTCFIAAAPNGTILLSQYNGTFESEPVNKNQLLAINHYSKKLVLERRQIFTKAKLVNDFVYGYPPNKSKLPNARECVAGQLSGQHVQYDERGYIVTGLTFRDVNPTQFTYSYRRNNKTDDELLRGQFVLPHMTIKVLWGMPPRRSSKIFDEWIPFYKVTEATFIEGENIYHATWDYEHKWHPEVSTTLNGVDVETPKMISEDWFKVLQKPLHCGFRDENPLLSFSSVKSNFITRSLGLNTRRYPLSTGQARNVLWKAWKGGNNIDAITARWMDEKLLRSDRVLGAYWRNRDFGRLEAAKQYLDRQADTVVAEVDIDPDISSWVHIAYKISDLYCFGQGGDATINTRTMAGQLHDNTDELHVLAMDTSTYPMEPGGVSACRRDMINDLKTIKWHIVAETANDYGVPKFQIEKNVQSLTILPLWGLDFLNPTHGMLQNNLDSAVVKRSLSTTDDDVTKNFLPILTSLVNCSRSINLKHHHIEEASTALVDLNRYFESSRNWNDVWSSEIVKTRWRELWLAEGDKNMLTVSQWWDFEKPTIKQLDDALNMWHRYLFIFSIPIPEKIPDIFQASHHFTGATYGIVCKLRRQCSLHVWDHCISFREFTTFMASAVSFDMPFVNSSLMSLAHLSCVLLEHHADVVLPCCDYFNPGWEAELGTAEGALGHRHKFSRKIDPVVNGICNMEKFEPIKEIKTDKPTVVMLSHVQYVKDLKSTIIATDLIVNKWGFKDYSVHIYGNMERAAGLSAECQELIASKNLQEHCILKGFGNPSVVLQDAWLFLNSSISEGLPLAMGEAALTGVPIVCTDVGASYVVVTDKSTGKPFSEVVPPNDAESLARAQINILALLGKWSKHAEDEPGVEPPILGYPVPTPQQVQAISDRMYAKREQRRKFGMMGRQNVFKNFSSDRYLLEHEQMLWIGKYRSASHKSRHSVPSVESDSFAWPIMQDKSRRSSHSQHLTPRRNPRLTPDSWISLEHDLEKKRGTRAWTREFSTSSLISSRFSTSTTPA